MSASRDWLEALLRQEHAALLTQLAMAATPAELRKLADAALTLAADLIALRTGGRALSLRGLPFWHFPDLGSFLREWPLIDSAIGKDRTALLSEKDMSGIVAELRGRGMFALHQHQPGNPGAILVIDTSLAEPDRLIGFLFSLALQRSAGVGDIRAILDSPDLRKTADPNASSGQEVLLLPPTMIAEIFRIILDSSEAATVGSGWHCL